MRLLACINGDTRATCVIRLSDVLKIIQQAVLSIQTLTLTREYAAAVKKPFPEINETMLEERDWPKDCYVFEGKEKEPTIVYMPLFNRRNCKGLLHTSSQH